jgi:phosphatidylglycerol:prolipoprotein diacylglycerol transferase
MTRINWNPLPHLGPVPINWYGLNWVLAFIVGFILVRRWSAQWPQLRTNLESLFLWIAAGSAIGARLYYIVQNEPWEYLAHPLRILAVWEGGLAYFGGLFGGVAAAYVWTRHYGFTFLKVADLFAPAIAIGSAIGRISCWLAGMDYGTPTSLPWGTVYLNPNSFAPVDGIPRHPAQVYELIGDLIIGFVLIRWRRKLPEGLVFWSYLVSFSVLRFLVFFVRGNVAPVLFGLKNGQITALVLLAAALVGLLASLSRWPGTRKQTS